MFGGGRDTTVTKSLENKVTKRFISRAESSCQANSTRKSKQKWHEIHDNSDTYIRVAALGHSPGKYSSRTVRW